MNLKIIFVVAYLFLGAISFQSFATSESADSQNIPLVDLPSEGTPSEGSSDDDDEYKKGDPSKRDRMPARPVNCSISREGVSINGAAAAIESFEVRDPEGNVVALFSTEQEFISFIFSSEGEFELIFRLPSRTLHGFINIYAYNE